MSYSPLFSGSSARAPGSGVQSNYPNASGSTLIKGSVVSINTSSQIVLIDLSDEDSVLSMVGITALDIPDAATGGTMSSGRLEDIQQSFAVGDAIYVGKDGIVSNVKPDYGVNGFVTGDFIVFVGVVVKNEFDPLKKDIQMMLSLVGQI